MAKEEIVDMLEGLCGHCWIIGSSGIIEKMTKNEPIIHDVVLTAGKLGEYYSGIGHLFPFGETSPRRHHFQRSSSSRSLRPPIEKSIYSQIGTISLKLYMTVSKIETCLFLETNYIHNCSRESLLTQTTAGDLYIMPRLISSSI
jgi:hypothetical protein